MSFELFITQKKTYFFDIFSRLKRQIVEASQSISSVVACAASLQAQPPPALVPSSSSSNNSMIKRPLPMSIPLPSDFSSASSSSTSPLSISSKNPQHRFDAASFLHSNFYELAAVAAAHAAAQAAAYHNNTNNKSIGPQNSVNENSEQNPSLTTATNSYSTFQDFATSLATQAAV
jgi:hypothetical protein